MIWKKFMINLNRKKLFFYSILSLAILVLNFYFLQCRIIGILFFGIWAGINSFWLGKFLRRYLNLEKGIDFIFGLFFLIFLISIAGAVFVVLYKITPVFIFLILLIINTANFFLTNNQKENNISEIFENKKISKLFFISFLILYLLSFYLLFQARTGKFILSPWEVIQPVYIYIFGLLCFLVLRFILLKQDWRLSLLFIILLSILLHSYLPIVYQTGFGGDKWRHLASEKWLQEGNIYSPALFGEEIQWQKIGPIKIPAVFIIGNKSSYASQWALTSVFSWIFKIDVFWIDLLLGLILCSLFIPIFFFLFDNFLQMEKDCHFF